MSPSSREQVTIWLSPQQVTMVRYSRGLRPRPRDRQLLACPVSVEGCNWQPAIEVLRETLVHPNTAPADATLVLSNHFVRYLLIPWNPDLVTDEEELALARARYMQVFGEVAGNWVLKLSRSKWGAAGVASAVERTLVDALGVVIGNSALTLRSIQPALMWIFNARTRVPADDVWMLVAEPGRLMLGFLRAGDWRSLRSRPLDGRGVALAEIIEQERLLVGVESAIEKVYLHRIGDPSLEVSGLKMESWLSDSVVLQRGGAG